MLLSALYVRYRDVSPIWGVISQSLFYVCPIFILIEKILPRRGSLLPVSIPLARTACSSPACG